MQLTRHGLTIGAAAVQNAREQFARYHCAVLPDFLVPELARQFAREADVSQADLTAHHRSDGTEFSQDLTISSRTAMYHGLHILLNNPQLFSVVQQITGCAPIGCFKGRVYRILPSAAHHLDWHDDVSVPGRLAALSISLSHGSPEGGVFRMRRKGTSELLIEVPQKEEGNAHLFAISREIEHCVTPVLGSRPRTAFAGWFYSSPDHRAFIRESLCGLRDGLNDAIL